MIRSEIIISQELPERVLTDKDRLTQAMLNLLTNAYKNTRKGSITLHIDPVTRKNDGAKLM